MRKFGLELEGYVEKNPLEINFTFGKKHPDASLRNTDWSELGRGGAYYGVEFSFHASQDYDIIHKAFEEALAPSGWHMRDDGRPATHVHVDVSDMTPHMIANLVHFCKLVEVPMFSLVSDARWTKTHCRKLPAEWVNIFENQNYFHLLDAPRIYGKSAGGSLEYNFRNNAIGLNQKYNWLNYVTNYSTVEFRLFDPSETPEQAIFCVMLSQAMVDFAAAADTKTVKFIANQINKEADINNAAKKLFEAINLDYTPDIVGVEATRVYNLRKSYQEQISGASF